MRSMEPTKCAGRVYEGEVTSEIAELLTLMALFPASARRKARWSDRTTVWGRTRSTTTPAGPPAQRAGEELTFF